MGGGAGDEATASEEGSPPAAGGAVAIGVVLVAVYAWHYPPAVPGLPSLSPLDAGKLAAAARSVIALLVLNLAALGAGRAFPRFGWSRPRGLAVVNRITLGLFALAHAVFVLGMLGWLSPRAVGLLVAAAAVASVPAILGAVRRWTASGSPRLAAHGVPALAWLMLPALALPLLSAFVPEYGWDALTYHLALPERFLRVGRLEFDPFSAYTVIPLLTEMLYAIALALDGPALAKLIHLELGVLLLVALASLASRFGSIAALFAAACLMADPLFLWEATIVYSDLALALLALLATAAVLDWDADPSPSALALAAVFCGLCAGVRYQGAFVGAALIVAVLLAGKHPVRLRLRFAAAVAAGIAVFVAPWLLRNLLHAGTPFAQNAFDPVLGRQLAAFREVMGMGQGFVAFLAGPWNVTMRTTPGMYSDSFGYQIGPLYLLSVILALAMARRNPEAALLLRSIVVQYTAWFLTFQESRYLLPTLVTAALAGAITVQRLFAAAPRTTRAAMAVAPAVATALALVTSWTASGPLYRIAFGDIPAQAVMNSTAAEEVGAMLRAEPRRPIRALALFESRTWHLRGVDSIPYHVHEGSPTLLAVHRALGARSLCRWLNEARVTHIVANTSTPRVTRPFFVEGYTAQDYARDLELLNHFLGSSAVLLRDVRGTLLFELHPPGQCRDPE